MTNLRILTALLLLTLPLAACPVSGTDDDDAVADDDDDSAANDDDSAGDDDDATMPQFPASPFPFSLELSGAEATSITVEQSAGCQNYSGSMNFTQQMSAGQWVVRVQVTGSYDGSGTYDGSMGATLNIQDNTSGGSFYQASSNSGDTITVQMDGDDGTRAWGTVTVSGLGGGALGVSPDVIPIWCENVVH